MMVQVLRKCGPSCWQYNDYRTQPQVLRKCGPSCWQYNDYRAQPIIYVLQCVCVCVYIYIYIYIYVYICVCMYFIYIYVLYVFYICMHYIYVFLYMYYIYVFYIYIYIYVFYGSTCGIWKFLGQGSNPSHYCNLHHNCGNTRSLTLCAGPRIKPMPQQWPQLLQRQCQILHLLLLSNNSQIYLFLSL